MSKFRSSTSIWHPTQKESAERLSYHESRRVVYLLCPSICYVHPQISNSYGNPEIATLVGRVVYLLCPSICYIYTPWEPLWRYSKVRLDFLYKTTTEPWFWNFLCVHHYFLYSMCASRFPIQNNYRAVILNFFSCRLLQTRNALPDFLKLLKSRLYSHRVQ